MATLTILHRCGEVITKKRFCVNQLNLIPDQEKEIKQYNKHNSHPKTYIHAKV
jgi:hypothetical protein